MKIDQLSLILLLLLGSACGTRSEVQVSDGVKRNPLPSAERIEAAKKGKLTCAFSGECEPALAMISVATSEGVSRCSGVLISEDEVLTNDHCLGTGVETEDDCNEYVFVHFTNDQNRGCSKIKFRSHQQGAHSKDYAIITLDRSVKDRKPMRISKRGFSNREKAVIFRVQMTENNSGQELDGIQNRMICSSSHGTVVYSTANSALVPVMSFGDCPVKEGNSGSPILNSNGEVGAIVQANLALKPELSDRIESFLLDKNYGEVALGTQTQCMNFISSSTAGSCGKELPIPDLVDLDSYFKEYSFQNRNLPIIPYNLGWLEFGGKSAGFKNFVNLPKCLTPGEARIRGLKFISEIVSYRQGLNHFLQSEWRPLYGQGEKQTVFERDPFVGSGIPKSVSFTSKDIGQIALPVCLKR